MIFRLIHLRGKTKLKNYQNRSNYYDETNYRRQSGFFQFEEDLFANNVQGIRKLFHEVKKNLNSLETKPQLKNMITNYYDLFLTVKKKLD